MLHLFFQMIAGAGIGTTMLPSRAAAKPSSGILVEHALGSTEVPVDPKRIVTLGWNGEDCLLALGVDPAAMPWQGSFAHGIFPWVEERLRGTRPVLLKGGLDFEAIALLRPDLILGIHSGIDERDYARLSKIAPTVVYRSGPWRADWREQIIVTGNALNRRCEAEAVLCKTQDFLGLMAATYPQLRGRTFTFGTFFAGESGVVVYLPNDQRVRILLDLGLRMKAQTESLEQRNPGLGSITIGLEELDQIDADVLVMWYVNGAREAFEAQPLFQTLGAVKRGAYVALEDPVEVWSTSALSVLSIPYGFPRFIPRLAEAASRAEAR